MNRSNRSTKSYINSDIKAKKVRCIDKDNNNIGVIPIYKALNLAAQDGLDLVQVSQSKSNIPTCKILDYGKFRYDLSKRTKAKEKKQRESIVKIKEIKFRPNTGENDLKIKARKTEEFLSDGCKVKVTIVFKGREKMHRAFAQNKLDLFLQFVRDINDKFDILSQPKADQRLLSVILVRDINIKSVEKAS